MIGDTCTSLINMDREPEVGFILSEQLHIHYIAMVINITGQYIIQNCSQEYLSVIIVSH